MFQNITLNISILLTTALILSACGNVNLSKSQSVSLTSTSETPPTTTTNPGPVSPYVNCPRAWNNKGIIATIDGGHGLTTDISWNGSDVYTNLFLQNTNSTVESFAVYKKNSNQIIQLNKPRVGTNCTNIMTGGFLSGSGLGTLLLCDTNNTIKASIYNPASDTWSGAEEYSIYKLHFDSEGVAYGLFYYWDGAKNKSYYQIRKRNEFGWSSGGNKVYDIQIRDFFTDKKGEVYLYTQISSPNPRIVIMKYSDLSKIELAVPADLINWTYKIQFDKFTEQLGLVFNSQSLNQNIFYEVNIKNWSITEVHRESSINVGMIFNYFKTGNGMVLANHSYGRLRFGTPDNLIEIYNASTTKIENLSTTIFNSTINERGDVAAIMATTEGTGLYKYRLMTYECQN